MEQKNVGDASCDRSPGVNSSQTPMLLGSVEDQVQRWGLSEICITWNHKHLVEGAVDLRSWRPDGHAADEQTSQLHRDCEAISIIIIIVSRTEHQFQIILL